MIALDLSWSVSYANSKLIEQTLRDFADSGRRLGLVLFSDTAYEALPLGTRSDALRPFLRFFTGNGREPVAGDVLGRDADLGGARPRAPRCCARRTSRTARSS